MIFTASIDFLTPISLTTLLLAGVVLVIGTAIARLAAGPPAEIARRRGLVAIRTVLMLLLLLLLSNPVSVSQTPGMAERAELFYLIDTSESMKMGEEKTRWREVVDIIRDAEEKTRGASPANVNLFRFGNRLASIENFDHLAIAQLDEETITRVSHLPVENSSVESSESLGAQRPSVVTPSDNDTRMLMALRQITSRFGRSPPSAIVLFSDGRARDASGMVEIAEHFAKLSVPIHVVPVGDTAKGGDIAIVAVVVPETARKQSQVEVQVFLRSYGYDDRRVEVHLSALGEDGLPERLLAPPQPLTLRSGFQSLSLSFRADSKTRRLAISVPVEPDEISSNNNAIEATIYIDRTKMRVLYVEGSRQLPQQVRRGDRIETRGPYTELRDALAADSDIECVVISAAHGDLRRLGPNDTLNANLGFPETSAELSAFDALILSNVSRSMFTDRQMEWIEQWISQRGGGLCMIGGPASFASGGWNEGLAAKILPVVMSTKGNDWEPNADVNGKVIAPPTLHPIWHIVSDARQNRLILDKFPSFEGANLSLQIKPALATPLVTANIDGQEAAANNVFGFNLNSLFGQKRQAERIAQKQFPVIAVGPYGKGRSMAMSTAITAPWANSFLNDWGSGNQRYYAKFWRNVVYWLTENSSIGRRRLIAQHDKRYYKPGESVSLRTVAYDEGARVTQDYRIVAMIEPRSAELDFESLYSPIRWPSGVPRSSGEEGPFIAWGEEFELPKLNASTAGSLGASQQGYGMELQIADMLSSGAANEGLRIELTAYEDLTQVDSTSIDIHILHDPFEHQNPFPNHELLKNVADSSGGEVLMDSDALAEMIADLPLKKGQSVIRKSPLWSRWWVWSLVVGLLTVEWFWRRNMGLA